MEYLEEGIESIKSNFNYGNFLTDDLTMKLLESDEFFKNDLFDISGGYELSISMLEKAHMKVDELTTDYKSPDHENIQENLRKYFHDLV